MTCDTKWYGTREGITIMSGGTLTVTDSITMEGNFDSTMTSIAVTNGVTVGTTLQVDGTAALAQNVAVGSNVFTVAYSNGNTVCAGTLNCDSTFAVTTDKFVVTSAGNVSAAGTSNLIGTLTVGTAASGKAIIISGGGTATDPGASNVRISSDGTYLYAYNHAGKNVKWTMAT